MRKCNIQSIGIRSALSAISPAGSGANLSILLFHKVPESCDPLVPDELDMRDFEHILDFLQENANVLPLMDAVKSLQTGRLPRRAVSITFDDGYSEWIKNVAPALLKRSLPATFFVTTDPLDGLALWHERIVSAVRALPKTGARLPFGFGTYAVLENDRTRAVVVRELQERLKYVPLQERLATISMLEEQAVTELRLPEKFDAKDVRLLHGMGFDIGAHTVKHPILNESTDEEAKYEIGGSKETLESIIGTSVKLFAYPNGRAGLDFQGKHVEIVKACGYQAAVSSSGGVANYSSDIYQLPRTTTWGRSHVHMAYHLIRNRFTKEKKVISLASNLAEITEVRCLLVASTFAPINGGSAVVYQNLCKHMPIGSIHVLTASKNYLNNKQIEGWKEYDATSSYPIDRLPLLRPLMLPPPANMFVSLYRLLVQDLVLYAKCLIKAAFIVKRNKINTICVGELVTGSWLGFALRKLFGCKVIIYVHGEEVTTKTGGRLHGNRRSYYLQNADKVIAVSQFTCDALTNSMGVKPTSIALIQNGVDTEFFTPGNVPNGFMESKGILGKRVILSVGRLVPRKGIDMAILAMKQVIRAVPEVHHVIVGDGEYRAHLQQIINEENLADKVTLVGKTSEEDLLSYIRCCEVFLMPNRTMPDGDTEGFGLVFREANACGKPVIGGRAGGVVEAVLDGITGILVDGNNPVDIAEALIKLLNSPEMAKEMGARGLKLAKENSTYAVSEKFLKICQRLVYVYPKSNNILSKFTDDSQKYRTY